MKTQAIWPRSVAAVGIALLSIADAARAQGVAVLVETPAKVFASFYAARTMTKKDEFEKTKDFIKRVGGAFDLNRTYFFPLKTRNTTRGNANYQYDADAEKLVAIAGHKPDHETAGVPRGTAMVIDTLSEDQGSYLGKASNGQKVQVKRSSIREYALNILNGSRLGEVLTPGENKLVVTAKVAPDEARKATSDLEVVVGVRFVSLSRARFELVYGHAPTVTEPWNSETTIACLDATVVRVLVRHRATGKVYRDLSLAGGEDAANLEAITPDEPKKSAPVIPVKADPIPVKQPETKPAPKNDSEGDEKNREALTVFWADPAKDAAILALGFKGTVEAQISIDAEGAHTSKLTKPSGNDDVDKAILSTLARWTWEPALKDGKPAASKKTLSFEFK